MLFFKTVNLFTKCLQTNVYHIMEVHLTAINPSTKTITSGSNKNETSHGTGLSQRQAAPCLHRALISHRKPESHYANDS